MSTQSRITGTHANESMVKRSDYKLTLPQRYNTLNSGKYYSSRFQVGSFGQKQGLIHSSGFITSVSNLLSVIKKIKKIAFSVTSSSVGS